jgi:xanthine dehydrogenase small subunit
MSTSRTISFVLDGEVKTLEFGPGTPLRPTTTVLQYLRSLPGHRGVKEGCAEGDCGACTVALADLGEDGRVRYRAIDSCLMLVPMLHGRMLVTVENLRAPDGTLHPVQRTMADGHGSQCGFCTPGIVMSLFALYQGPRPFTREQATMLVSGNLCRCTGYRTILDAAMEAPRIAASDHFDADETRLATLLRNLPCPSLAIETADQHYFRPATLAEALALRGRHPEAVIVNGATDVGLRITIGHEILSTILDLSGVAELGVLESAGDDLVIGAGVRLADLMDGVATRHTALQAMLRWFGSNQIRNLATLGGNLGTASPIGDSLPALIASRARVRVASSGGTREFAMSEFVLGYRTTACRPDELITAVVLPAPAPDEVTRFYKVSRRREMDISTASAAFRLVRDRNGTVREVTLAYGGMAETARRAPRTEAWLTGRSWTRETIDQALPMVEGEFTPISDTRGSAEMRGIVARNLLMKFFVDTTGASASTPEVVA